MAKAKPDELVDEIEQIRERLADTVDALIDRTSPRNIARRGLYRLRLRFVDETGSPRLETIIPIVGATGAAVAGIIVLRKLLR